MKIDKKFVYRVLVYALGLLFLAFSVALAANANLGISPVNSLPYVVSLITSLPVSTCVILVFCSYILLQIILLRREFRWINLFQIAFSTLFAYFVDFAKWVLGDWAIPTYAGSLVMTAISIVVISIGVALYVDVDLIPMPAEGLSLALSKKTGVSFPNMKMILDCSFVALAALLSLLFLHKLVGVREGTVLAALLVGKVVGFLQRWIKPLVRKLCF